MLRRPPCPGAGREADAAARAARPTEHAVGACALLGERDLAPCAALQPVAERPAAATTADARAHVRRGLCGGARDAGDGDRARLRGHGPASGRRTLEREQRRGGVLVPQHDVTVAGDVPVAVGRGDALPPVPVSVTAGAPPRPVTRIIAAGRSSARVTQRTAWLARAVAGDASRYGPSSRRSRASASAGNRPSGSRARRRPGSEAGGQQGELEVGAESDPAARHHRPGLRRAALEHDVDAGFELALEAEPAARNVQPAVDVPANLEDALQVEGEASADLRIAGMGVEHVASDQVDLAHHRHRELGRPASAIVVASSRRPARKASSSLAFSDG